MSPHVKRSLFKILPFGIIWLCIGWIFLFVEYAATRNQELPDEVITMSVQVFAFASITVFFVGLLIGTSEVLYLNRFLHNQTFIVRLFVKVCIYTLALFVMICIVYPMAASIDYKVPYTDPIVWSRLVKFLSSITFLSTMFQMGISLFISLFYAGISDNLGHAYLNNYFTGRYHEPFQEQRIFMFLDMKGSTTAAEKLGHKRYFNLLKDFYDSLSDSIITHEGAVYQYIGDEVVITWSMNYGLRDVNCIHCFFSMREALELRATYFEQNYGIVPSFKAGLHFGEVTTGEIGALKKEIFFTGDVLNATSRIQQLCSTYKKDFIVSNQFYNAITDKSHFQFEDLGKTSLKGREEKMQLYAVSLAKG